eukprot:TRINITY_DN7350_c1_g1_i4.p2 TRINITY_DN7350_c1_g1~~TRINITY_DN7350_c1_g1_i4.p2  ORF type:complete len:113 (-),score=15.68 TRINITY_DN7350_c1_g1_i4:355-693(-)
MTRPTDEDKVEDWETKESQIMSWILGSVNPIFFMHLKPDKTAKEMWACMKRIYHQENSARRYQLEHEIAQFCQGNLSVQDNYSGFIALWTEYTDIAYASVTGRNTIRHSGDS